MRTIAAAALLMALGALPAPALAQAYQCTLPSRVGDVKPIETTEPARRTAVAGYTLAASWSPEFCRDGRDAGAMQCSGANGRFGFVLHGLWPEAKSGPPPQWCSLTPRPSPQLIRSNLCMTPVPKLLAHEWAKHGSCMAKTPDTYFKVAGILWRSVRWPDADRLSRRKDLTAGDLKRAFVIANPGWRPSQMALVTSRSGWLREIRLCYGRDFKPADCPRGQRDPADTARLKIWRGF